MLWTLRVLTIQMSASLSKVSTCYLIWLRVVKDAFLKIWQYLPLTYSRNILKFFKATILKNIYVQLMLFSSVNPLSAIPTRWSNTLKQFIGKLPTNYLSVFADFVGLALKGLIILVKIKGAFHKENNWLVGVE